MKKYFKVLAVLFVGVIEVAAISVGFRSGIVMANNCAGDGVSCSTEGGGGSKGCYIWKRQKGGLGKMNFYDDTCFGGLWLEYPVNGNNNIKVASYGSVSGGTLSGCVDLGADKYYRLSLVKYNTHDTGDASKLKFSNFTLSYVGGRPEQVGLWQVYRFANAGGGTLYRSEGEDWNEIERKYKVAKEYSEAHGKSIPEWRDISMFCYSEAWEKPDSKFNSWSYGSVDGENHFNTFSTPDTTKEIEVEVESDTVEVAFDHQLSYVPPSVDGTFGSAYTVWHTEVTDNGQRIGGTSSTRYTEDNGGPNTSNGYWDSSERFSNILGGSSNTIEIDPGETRRVCSTIYYTKKFIAWTEQNYTGWNGVRMTRFTMNEAESSESASSTACVVIKRAVPERTEGDYTSRTTVKIPTQGDDIHERELTSEEDGKDNNILISTDQADVEVQFWHEVIWNGSICPPEQPDGYDDACDEHASTPYKITTETQSEASSGTHNGDTGIEGEETVIVHLEKGETKKVCRRITYTQKYIPFESYLYNHGTSDDPDYRTHYKIVDPNGTGYSEACATITRPADPFTPVDPDPNNPGTPKGPTEGSADANLMYAGEQTSIGWQASAITYDTRRLMEWQAIVFQVPVQINGNNSNARVTNGNISSQENQPRYQDTPCQWFDRALDYRNGRCDIAKSSASDGETTGSGGKHTYSWADGQFSNSSADMSGNEAKFSTPFKIDGFSEGIVAPSLVGDKHCNSFGFKMQYWYGYTKEGSTEWYIDTEVPAYWKTYDAACLTVAKKPSVATWNGGLSIGSGNVLTSISNRYDNSEVGINVFSGGTPIAFGSWSEYLATINGSVDGFASGASLASGLTGPFSLTKKSSPLTIANTPDIGSSGITTNSILRDRIRQYFLSDTSGLRQRGADLQVIGGTLSGGTYSGTTILQANGNLRITGNITTNKNVSTIYNLPQVIIYASGDIEIASDVTEIDAWIIAEGKINTCAEFTENVTQASVRGWSEGTTCSRNLKINGPVFASKVELNRSYGSDGYSNNDRDLVEATNRAATGEVFNLSADSYLWAYAQGGRYNSSYTEAYSRELPPRY